MTVTINQEQLSPNPDAFVELYQLDTTNIGGSTIYYFTPMTTVVGTGTPLVWQGNTYVPFPIMITGMDWSGTTQAPAKPMIQMSNVNQYLMSAILTLGDMCGARLTRWRTFYKFLDGQSNADATAHYPPDIYLIDQKTIQSKSTLEFTLTALIDRPGLMLPIRQILRDPTGPDGSSFPGVARI